MTYENLKGPKMTLLPKQARHWAARYGFFFKNKYEKRNWRMSLYAYNKKINRNIRLNSIVGF